MRESIAIALLAVAVFAGPRPARSEPLKEAPMFRLRDLSGTWVQMKSVLARAKSPDGGATRVLLTFFALSCEPCKKELALLQGLKKSKKGHRVIVLVVALPEKQGDQAAISEYFERHPVTASILVDPFSVVAMKYGVVKSRGAQASLPSSFVITPEGSIEKQWSGLKAEHLKALFR